MTKSFKFFAIALALMLVIGLLLTGADLDKISMTNTAVGVGLQTVRTGACSAPLKDGTVLISGGRGPNGVTAGAQIFGAKAGASDTAAMAAQRADHACAALPDGRVLVAGGTTLGGGTVNTAEMFDPATGQWSAAGSMSVPRS